MITITETTWTETAAVASAVTTTETTTTYIIDGLLELSGRVLEVLHHLKQSDRGQSIHCAWLAKLLQVRDQDQEQEKV
jgi:hypothetical protein